MTSQSFSFTAFHSTIPVLWMWCTFFLPRCMTLHLAVLKYMLFNGAQCIPWSRKFCRVNPSLLLFPTSKTLPEMILRYAYWYRPWIVRRKEHRDPCGSLPEILHLVAIFFFNTFCTLSVHLVLFRSACTTLIMYHANFLLSACYTEVKCVIQF